MRAVATSATMGKTMPTNVRQGTEFVTDIPESAGQIVAMCIFQGRAYLACQFGVYEIIEAAHPEPRKIREILTLSHGANP
jgi:hypothetical protein